MSILIGFIAGLVTGIALMLGIFFGLATVTLKKKETKIKTKRPARPLLFPYIIAIRVPDIAEHRAVLILNIKNAVFIPAARNAAV